MGQLKNILTETREMLGEERPRIDVGVAKQAFNNALNELKRFDARQPVWGNFDQGGYTDQPFPLESMRFRIDPAQGARAIVAEFKSKARAERSSVDVEAARNAIVSIIQQLDELVDYLPIVAGFDQGGYAGDVGPVKQFALSLDDWSEEQEDDDQNEGQLVITAEFYIM